MMPFLFPFTYISQPDLTTCCRFFKGIKVFQFSNKTMPPEMKTLLDMEQVESVWPDPSTCLSFEAALAETERWAQSHRLGAASYAKGYKDRIPFFNASSVSRIRQDIRRADQQASTAGSDENEIITAYIFLYMAQAFDIQNQTIVQKLQQHASMEKTLYAELRGDTPLAHRDQIEDSSDTAQFMLLDRLKAWSRVWMASGDSRDLFVTMRPAVILLIQEHLLQNEDCIQIATVPPIDKEGQTTHQPYQDLWSYCHKLAFTDLARIRESGLLDTYTPSAAPSDGMQLYLLPGIKPQQLFDRFVGGAHAIKTCTPKSTDAINTVIGLLGPHGA